MATTRIMPLHIGKGRSVGTAVSDILEYVKDTEKTDQGRLVTCFQCNPEIADAEFCFSKRRYQASTGRKQENDVIAYHVRQSFKPGEITPEEANRLGCEFAERFLKGNHAYMVERSNRVIAVYDGREKGGTVGTIRLAHMMKKELREIAIGEIYIPEYLKR